MAGLEGNLWPDVAFTIAIIAGGPLVFPKALRSLKTFSLDMNVLMTVAVIGAVAVGEDAPCRSFPFMRSSDEREFGADPSRFAFSINPDGASRAKFQGG
jgi:hypothetical protein